MVLDRWAPGVCIQPGRRTVSLRCNGEVANAAACEGGGKRGSYWAACRARPPNHETTRFGLDLWTVNTTRETLLLTINMAPNTEVP